MSTEPVRLRRKKTSGLSEVGVIPFLQIVEGPAPEEPWVRCVACRANVSHRLAKGRYCAPCLAANAPVAALPLLPELWQLIARTHLLPIDHIPLRLVCRGLLQCIPFPAGLERFALFAEALKEQRWVAAWAFGHLETTRMRGCDTRLFYHPFWPRTLRKELTREPMRLMSEGFGKFTTSSMEEDRWAAYELADKAPVKRILKQALKSRDDLTPLLARIRTTTDDEILRQLAFNWGHVEVADRIAPDSPPSWHAVRLNCRYGRPAVVAELLHRLGHTPERKGILELVYEAAGHGHLPVLNVLGELLPWAFARMGILRRKMFTWFTKNKVSPAHWAWFARVFPVTRSAQKRLKKLGHGATLADCALFSPSNYYSNE
jgi:hypothetical protein